MKKILTISLTILILPAALIAGLNFGLIKTAKKRVDKIDAKVVLSRSSTATALDAQQAPTVPTNLTAVAVSSSQINLTWTASTDNVGVSGYKIYRNGGTTPIAMPNGTTYNDTGLTTLTPYSYTISACDAAGNCSSQSITASTTTLDTQAPTVPTNLTVVAVSSCQINLSWTASTDNVGVTSYKIYRNGGATPIATPTGITYNNTGLAASTAHFYTVSACDAAGNCSAKSTSASDTTFAPPDTQAPTVPTNLTAVAVSSCQINLSWTASIDDVGVTSYRIYRDGGATPIATPTYNTYTNTGLTGGTAYSYTVSACDVAGNCSAQSITASTTTTPDTQAPTVPTNLTTVAISSFQINLSWTASTDNIGVTNYKIYRDGGATPIATPTVPIYNNTGLTAGTPYSYTVSACDAASNCSGQSSAAIDTTALWAVGGEWVLVPGSTTLGTNDFYVMKYEAKNVGGAATSQANITPWVSISHTDAIAACTALGPRYHLLTIAETQTINRNIEAQSANWANGIIGSLVSAGGGLKRGNVGLDDSASYNGYSGDYGTTPSADRILKARLILSNGGEIWDWAGNVWERIYGAGAGGIQGTPNGVTFDMGVSMGGWPEWNIANLNEERPILGPSNSGWTADYGVGKYAGGATTNAVCRGGGEGYGAISGVFAFYSSFVPSHVDASFGFRCGLSLDTQAPTVPANLIATAAGSNQINLSWTASTDNVGVTSYNVYRDGGAAPIATPTGTTYNDIGLAASTAYSYTVSACDTSGNCSAQSITASDTTAPDTQAPTVPTNLTAVTVSSCQINLSWTASTDDIGVSSYKIYRDGGATPIATPTGTTYSNTGLTFFTAYSYTVSACDAVGNCSGQSSAASDTTPQPPPTVGGEWVLVPGSAAIGTSDFYVMKYEAKNVGGVATSQANITPWVSITHMAAKTACSALGGSSHLIAIAEVQTINRNIEAQSANWANGLIGSLVSAGGGLKRGNVGTTDSASYNGANPEYGSGRDAKALLVLSNGGQIWDWSGNVYEWFYGAGLGGKLGTPGGVIFITGGGFEWNIANLDEERPILGPSNGSYTSLYGVGRYYGGATTTAGVRGGDYYSSVDAGVFAFDVSNPSSVSTTLGFRCSTLDTQAPTVPTNFTAVAVSSTQIDLNWTASTDNVGVTRYQLYRGGGATPMATQTGITYNDTGLTDSTAYSYTVSACDAVDNCSEPAAASDTTAPLTVGGEWVLVPGSAMLGTSDFYVMKYEAKNVGGVATSQATRIPWILISQTDAITACSTLGSGSHLLTIPEVQTINRNIEAQSANWGNGVIGSLVSAGGGLKRGNVGQDDSVSYHGFQPEFGTGRNIKAKHLLSNSGEIWDWSGNVEEWIYGAGAGGILGTPGGVTFTTGGGFEWNIVNLNEERPILGPSNGSWTTAYGVGNYSGGATTDAAYRGGDYNPGVHNGVFAFQANGVPPSGWTSGNVGFRCGR